jgi:hypothetical protein
VVVRQINIESVAIFKAKNNPPVGAHDNRPKALEVTDEGMQAQSRKVHVFDPLRRIQKAENIFDPLNVFRAYTFSITVVEEALKILVTKAHDHWFLPSNGV